MYKGPFSYIAKRGVIIMNFKILVADDEYYARKVLVMMLEKSGLPILVEGDFEDGEEVIEYLQENEADIIITDAQFRWSGTGKICTGTFAKMCSSGRNGI